MDQYGWTIGEAYYFRAMCKALLNLPGVEAANVYDLGMLPESKLDVLVHVNDTEPMPVVASKHVLYLQNGYENGMDAVLANLRRKPYNGYVFISQKLMQEHVLAGYSGIYLPFGVDTSLFQPHKPQPEYTFAVAYVGNDIKGPDRTIRYLCPALNYNFGLFGKWEEDGQHPEKQSLCCHSRGKLKYQKLPLLYSNANINLNVTSQDQVNWGAMTDRPFQIMACRGFVLSDIVPGFEHLNSCMAVTHGGIDTMHKIDYYLSHPKEREELAANGYNYVIRHATIGARASELLDYLRTL